MRRRDFIKVIAGSTAAWPLVGHAQQIDRVKRIGALISIAENDPELRVRLAAFLQDFPKLGWTVGGNVRIDYRYGSGDNNRIKAHAAELVATKPDVIFASGTQTVAALLEVTNTIPIVFVLVDDPVGSGFVASLSRPGGNVTGFSTFEYTVGGKWVATLKEIAPHITRVVAMLDRQNISSTGHFAALQIAGSSIGMRVDAAGIRNNSEIPKAIDEVARVPNSGLVVLPSATFTGNRGQIIAHVAQQRLPAIYAYAYFPKSGGLISYGIDVVDLYRKAAPYIDRVLRGANPSDLPIQQPTKFELAINLKTAKALGLAVSPQLLARADEVIE